MSLLVKPNSNTPFGVSQRIIRENKGWKWLEILLSLLQWLYLQHIFFQDVKNPFLDIYMLNGESLNRIFTQIEIVVERSPNEWNCKF